MNVAFGEKVTERRYYIGSLGPYFYDDADDYDDPDGAFYWPGAGRSGFVTDGQIWAEEDIWSGGNVWSEKWATDQKHCITLRDVQKLVPAGMIVMWSGATVPDGWYLCNGSNGTPNLTDKFILGSGTNAIGATGGNTLANMASKVLTAANLPNHRHTISNQANHPGHSGSSYYEVQLGATPLYAQDGHSTYDGAHNHGGYTGYEGSGTGVNIAPPYYVLAFIMKAPY